MTRDEVVQEGIAGVYNLLLPSGVITSKREIEEIVRRIYKAGLEHGKAMERAAPKTDDDFCGGFDRGSDCAE